MPRSRARRRTLNNRPLRFESLEDRRLLSITVNTLVDENDGINVGGISLRDAIAAAAPGDTINFAPSLRASGPATILLNHHELPQNGELVINKSLTIMGPDANLLTIDASGNDPTPNQKNGDGSRVFHIDDNSFSNKADVVIDGVTITGGDVGTTGNSTADWSGGAILAKENLTIQHVSILGNAAQYQGGAIEFRRISGTNGATLHIVDSIVSGNTARSTGAAINAYGQLTIDNSQVSDNSGGGIASDGFGASLVEISDTVISHNVNGSGLVMYAEGAEHVLRCTITSNDSPTQGGGLSIGGTGSVVVSDNVIRNNHSAVNGGGLNVSIGDTFPFGGTADIRRNLIENNSSDGDGGGVRLNASSSSALTFSDNTTDGNSADAGGGVLMRGGGGSIDIVNSTISGNSATGFGGGMFVENVFSSNLAIDNSTISANISDSPASGSGAGGGIFVQQGLLHVRNSIVAANVDNNKLITDIGVLLGTLDLHFGLIGDNTGSGLVGAPVGSPDANGNLIGSPSGMGLINPRLGTLAQNGGETPTQPLLAGSPAIDAGDPAFASILPNDERGDPFVRKVGAHIDMGAYERQTLAATDYLVDTSSDEYDGDFSAGHLSLREAVGLANGSVASPQTIRFAPTLAGQTLLLSHGQLDVTDNLAIIGLGSNQLTIDASGNDPTPQNDNGDGSRIFNIDNGDPNFRSQITVSDLTLTGGDVNGTGGAVRTVEDLTLQRMSIVSNSAVGGGGVWSWPKLILFTPSNGLSVQNSLISGNLATGPGEIIENASVKNGGGGIAAFYNLTLVQSTISGNTSNGLGGGVFSGSGMTTIRYSTITANRSNSSYITTAGGGLAGAIQGTNSILDHTIIAGNFGTAPDWLADTFYPGVPTAKYSLIGSNVGDSLAEAFTSPDTNGNRIGGPTHGVIDPKLGPLADNGGPTEAHALLPGSPAINSGDPAAVAGAGGVPQFDQRGTSFGRVFGGRIDIGAVEFQPNPLPGDYNFNGIVDAADYVIWRVTNGSTTDLRADGSGPTVGAPNGVVDQADFDFWKSHFGNALMSGAGASSEKPGATAERELSEPLAPAGNHSEAPIIQQSAITNQQFLANPQSNFSPPSAPRLPSPTHDSALLLWLAAQPRSIRSDGFSVAPMRAQTNRIADEAVSSLFDPVDAAFDELAVNS